MNIFYYVGLYRGEMQSLIKHFRYCYTTINPSADNVSANEYANSCMYTDYTFITTLLWKVWPLAFQY